MNRFFFLALLCLPQLASAQVATGLVDFNSAPAATLSTLPNLTPALADKVVQQRPFASIVDVNVLLLAGGITAEQAIETYKKAFVHIDLNVATSAEILLIPGAGRKMAHEFDEYRPWKTFAQFDKEIGKYVGADGANRLKQYCFIPMAANTASDDLLKTIPALSPKALAALKAARPLKSKEQLVVALSKATDATEAKRLSRYLTL